MDSILVFPPGASSVGSAIQLGSWLMADPGPDFGAHGLIESIQAQNALRDGGVFALRHAPIRKMVFPLVINTASVVNWEGQLARWTTPGAFIAVQPEGIPSSQAVYFDVIDGRWEPDYNLFENRAHVRKGNLHLETQPFGYWPTEILLASAASIGFIGQLAIPGGSIIGDVPPLAHIQIAPTAASFYQPSIAGFPLTQANWQPDMVAVSLAARPSFVAYIPAASLTGYNQYTNGNAGVYLPTLLGDKYAPGSQAMAYVGTSIASGGWFPAMSVTIPSALEPAYRGRFRVFGIVNQKSSPTGNPWLAMIDGERAIGTQFTALASSNQVATIPMTVTVNISTFVPSILYHTLDLGEITLPPGGASGNQTAVRLRMWLNAGPSVASYAASPIQQIGVAGLYLLPVDGPAGILTGGLWTPSIGMLNTGFQQGAPNPGAAEFNQNWVDGATLVVKNFPPPGDVYSDGRARWRGGTLRLGASTVALNFLTGDRYAALLANALGATYPVAQANVEYSQVSVSYRPQFQWLYGV